MRPSKKSLSDHLHFLLTNSLWGFSFTVHCFGPQTPPYQICVPSNINQMFAKDNQFLFFIR